MRRYACVARAPPGALWADTSGVASFRRTEWWAGARGHRSGVRSVERAGARHPPGGGTAGRVV